jgi:DMSO/TMAO reductase YedYZ heme-binding membrane subunit
MYANATNFIIANKFGYKHDLQDWHFALVNVLSYCKFILMDLNSRPYIFFGFFALIILELLN